jgi:hypothetical protein
MLSTDYRTDSRADRRQFHLPVHHAGDNSEGGRQFYAPGVTYKPSSNVLLSLSPSLDVDNTAQQYMAVVSDPTVPTPFAGNRYIFGRLQQKTYSMDTRVNVTFTPNLSLEMFAQPFLASGHSRASREFAYR